MVLRLSGNPDVSVGDVEVISIDYTDWLDSGESLTGSPTVAEQTTTDLTIANEGLNASAVVVNGRSVAANAAVQFKVSGGTTANSPYTIRVTISTDATVARTAVRDLNLTYE